MALRLCSSIDSRAVGTACLGEPFDRLSSFVDESLGDDCDILSSVWDKASVKLRLEEEARLG